jgi:plastocyanin
VTVSSFPDRSPARLGLLAATLVAMLVLAACGGNEPSASAGGGGERSEASGGESEGGTLSIKGEDANDHGSEEVTARTTSLEQDDYYFEPTVLQGKAAQKVSIELENEGDAAHTFTIDDQNIDVEVQPGGSAEVDVTFPDSGTVVFYCRFHRSQGMLGELSVGS